MTAPPISTGITPADVPDGSDGPPLLGLTNISKGFPGVQALQDVSFDLRAGEVARARGRERIGEVDAHEDRRGSVSSRQR